MKKANILFFDLETIVLPFTSGERLRAEDTAIVCFGYAWEDQKANCIHVGQHKSDYKKNPFNDRKILEKAAKLILEADIVVAHFGSGFDKPMLRSRLILEGFEEAAAHLQRIKCYDTCLVARKLLRLRSSSLRYLGEIFKLGEKDPMSAEDWNQVMRSNPKAILKMAKYCAKDVDLLQAVYHKLKGLDNTHPNTVFEKEKGKLHCPTCTSTWVVINSKPWLQGKQTYQNCRCRKCGSNFRGTKLKD